MDDAVISVSENKLNDLSEESNCETVDALCQHAGMQSGSSKNLSNSPDKNENNFKKSKLDFNVSSKDHIDEKSSEFPNYGKADDHGLANYPIVVNQHHEIFEDQHIEEIVPKNVMNLLDDCILPKNIDQHDGEDIFPKNVMGHHDEDILPNDVVDQHGHKGILSKNVVDLHDYEKEILEDQHNGETILPKNVVTLPAEDILPKNVSLPAEDILPRNVSLPAQDILPKSVIDQQDEILRSDVIDQQNQTSLPKDVDPKNANLVLPKDDVLNDDSCDFFLKNDVNKPDNFDNHCDVNDLDSEEPKNNLLMDEDSCDRLSNGSNSSQNLEILDIESTGNRIHKSREKNALPYFQLPKPDLEEFLIETDKKLHDSEKKSPDILHKVLEHSTFKPSKDQFIVFEINGGPVTPMDKFKNRFMNQTKMHADPSPRVSQKNFQGLQINSPLLSKEMDEKDSPGFKRLVLKEYLKQKIDEKKVAAFNRSKEMLKLDEEEDIESDDSAESFSDDESNEFQKRIEKMMAPKVNEDVLELEREKDLDQNLEATCDDSEKLEVETDYLGHAGECESDEDLLSNQISKKDKNVLKNHNSFHTDSEESDDEIMFSKKSKHCKRVIEDSDEESDVISVSYGNSLNKNKKREMEEYARRSEENSCDSVNATVNEMNDECESVSSVSSSNQDALLESNSVVKELYGGQKHSKEYFSATPEISSSAIPSYQPGGGFQNEESNDSSDSISSGSKSVDGSKCLKNMNLASSFSSSQGIMGNRLLSPNTPLDDSQINKQFSGNYSTRKTPAFGVNLSDLPISQEDSDNMFASQDVDNICSGIFQNSALPSSLLEESILKLKDPDVSVVTEKVEDFFDAEAELSGDDDGLDDDSDGEGNEAIDIIADDEDLPSDEELRDGIADLFMKRINDDDDMLIKKVQEHFLDDGELNADGAGRSRRFQWKNDDVENNDQLNMSDSDNEEPDENWNAVNREKVKWQQENEQVNEDLNSEEFVKKPILKMKILGKTDNLIDLNEAPLVHLKRKRPRGSLFNLDDGSASQVLKKLKAAEVGCNGSRTTKHFVFRNDVIGDVAVTKEVVVSFAKETSSTHVETGELSVFDNI